MYLVIYGNFGLFHIWHSNDSKPEDEKNKKNLNYKNSSIEPTKFFKIEASAFWNLLSKFNKSIQQNQRLIWT